LNPSFPEIPINKQIKGEHREIIEEVFEWYSEEPAVPHPITTPDGHRVIQYDGRGGEQVIEDYEGNHRYADVEPVVP
jgi:hypothetical protein